MPIKCVLCHLRYQNRGNRSFHRFPIDLQRRKQWLSCIGKVKLAGKSYLCSDHFSSSDLKYSASGLRKLSRHAVPVPGLSETETASEVGDESSSSGKESVAEMISNRSNRFHKSTSATDTPVEIRDNDPVIYAKASSETESLGTSTNYQETLRLRNLQRRKHKVYSGDKKITDMKSSERDDKFFHFAKNVLEKQKLQIKNLRRKYSRLENKITSLNNLMNRLIEQNI